MASAAWWLKCWCITESNKTWKRPAIKHFPSPSTPTSPLLPLNIYIYIDYFLMYWRITYWWLQYMMWTMIYTRATAFQLDLHLCNSHKSRTTKMLLCFLPFYSRFLKSNHSFNNLQCWLGLLAFENHMNTESHIMSSFISKFFHLTLYS